MSRVHDEDENITNDFVDESCVHGQNELSSPLLSSNSFRQRRNEDVIENDMDHHSRILDRSGAFHQSRGRWGVHRLSRRHSVRRRCLWLCGCLRRFWMEWVIGDWFHRLAYQPTCVLMMILVSTYVFILVFFAFVYLGVSKLGQHTEINPDGSEKIIAFCDMDINNHMEALYFSLSTMASIGYGVSDYYFGGCWTPLLLVLAQVCCGIAFDAVAVGLLFHRISRGRKRGKTIAFSNKAVIQWVKGVPHLMFRLGELRKYHLIEGSVQCYCVRHERLPTYVQGRTAEGKETDQRAIIETTHFVCRRIKLLCPDEEYESRIWMGLPQVVVHRMDEMSPLVPPPTWYDGEGMAHTFSRKNYSNFEHEQDPLGEPSQETLSNSSQMENMKRFLSDRDAEVVVLVEGTDEGTGSETQARHSYKLCDLAWNHKFVPCIYPYSRRRNGRGEPICSVDFSVFHNVVPAPYDCDACAYVPY